MDGDFCDPRDTLRIPPQSVEAEQAVLGGLMLAGYAWPEVSDLLGASDFYRRDHQLIWQAVKALDAKGQPFDAVTLGEWFESNGLIEQVAGGAYLIELASTTPSAANIRAYADIVADKSRLRRMIEVGTKLVNDGFIPEGQSSVELIGRAQTRIAELLQSQPCELEEIGPVLNRMFENLERRHALNGAIDGLSTGLSDFDRMINGLKGGRVYYIAARPAMGKTTLALNIAEHIAVVEGQPVAVFSFEMPQEELTERLTCSLGRVDHERFRTGQLDDDDWHKAYAAIKALKSAPIRLSRPRNVRVESVVAQARRLHAREPQGVIIVDYLQLLDTKGAENRTQGITEVSRQLKMLAIDLDVPVIVLSQLNRSLEARADKRPMMSDLRESGAIEQDADVIAFIYRDEIYNAGSADKGTAEIIIGKQRNGPPGTIRVAARLDICRFDDLANDWERPTPADDPMRRGFGRRGGRDRAVGADT